MAAILFKGGGVNKIVLYWDANLTIQYLQMPYHITVLGNMQRDKFAKLSVLWNKIQIIPNTQSSLIKKCLDYVGFKFYSN